MKNYLVYKFTNKINDFCYIGITSSPIERRIKRHLEDSQKDDGLYFHRALNKYGLENFSIEILEENILEQDIDKKEKYYIELYNSFFLNGHGYNMTIGGRRASFCKRVLSDKDIKDIQYKLKNNLDITAQEISKEYGVSFSLISDINTGRVWRNTNIIYPIREHEIREITQENFFKVIKMLQSKLFSTVEISEILNISSSLVSRINTGDYKKFEYPSNITFPIVNRKISNSKINAKDALDLLTDYLNQLYSYKELSEKYNISISYVKGIVTGNNLSNITQNCKFPLKQAIDFNKEVIENQKILLKSFE